MVTGFGRCSCGALGLPSGGFSTEVYRGHQKLTEGQTVQTVWCSYLEGGLLCWSQQLQQLLANILLSGLEDVHSVDRPLLQLENRETFQHYPLISSAQIQSHNPQSRGFTRQVNANICNSLANFQIDPEIHFLTQVSNSRYF